MALSAFSNNADKTMNFMMENRELMTRSLEMFKTKLTEMAGANQATSSKSSEMVDQLLKKANAQNLMENLAGEIPDDDEAYLDLNTDEDEFYINKYYSLLDSSNL